jgi:hypothetical protein
MKTEKVRQRLPAIFSVGFSSVCADGWFSLCTLSNQCATGLQSHPAPESIQADPFSISEEQTEATLSTTFNFCHFTKNEPADFDVNSYQLKPSHVVHNTHSRVTFICNPYVANVCMHIFKYVTSLNISGPLTQY